MTKWLLLTFLAAVTLASAGAPSRGAAQEALELRIDAVDTAGFPDIQATVTVLDASGRPVVDLTAAAFQASAGGQTLPIKSVAGSSDEGQGIAVVLTFDVSGSMQGQAIEQAKQAGKTLVNELRPNDQVAILAFANSVQVVQPFTQDRQALTSAIDSLVASGNTALYDGVVRSVETARASTLPRRAVVLLSDGVDFGGVSQNDRASSLAAAQSAAIPTFLIGLGDSIDQPYLQELANAARGQLFLAPTPEALSALYQTIGAILRHQYLLTIDGSSLAAGASPTLRIQVTQNGVVAAAEATLTLPAPPLTVTPAASPAPSPPVATPATSQEGGSKLLPLLLGVAGVAGLTLVGGAIFWRRRGGRRREEELQRLPEREAQRPIFAATGPAVEAAPAQAWLQLISPPGNQTYPLGEAPVEIGFTTDCEICLPAGATHRWERVRVWRREGRYMMHNLSRMGSVSVAGRPAIWVVLEDGDEIQLGSCRLRFSSAPPAGGAAGS